MTLSDKERYTFHMAVAMTLAITKNIKLDVKKVEEIVLKNRARHITEEELDMLRDDIGEEMLVGQTLYEEIIGQVLGKDPEKFR